MKMLLGSGQYRQGPMFAMGTMRADPMNLLLEYPESVRMPELGQLPMSGSHPSSGPGNLNA